MLEYFRKYSMVAFIVLILLFLGLIFMVDGVGNSGMGTGPKMLTYDGRSYTQSQVEREGQNYGSMFLSLLEPGRTTAFMDLLPYAQVVKVSPQGFEPRAYLANRLLLGDLMSKYGVRPDQEQVEAFITETLFTDQNGEFNGVGYNDFIVKRVNRMGLGVQDFNNLISEVIAASKLKDIIGDGYAIDEELTRKAIKINQQEITYEQFALPVPSLRDSIKVSDEDVQAYWELNKNNYLSEAQIKVQYTISDAKVTELELEGKKNLVEKARQEGKTAEEIAQLTFSLPVEEKSQKIDAAGDKIDQLFVNIQDADGQNFTKLVSAIGLEVKTTELFTQATAPFDLTVPLYQAQGTVAQNLFRISDTGETMDSLSDVLGVGEGRFLLAQVIERKSAEPLPFEDVKDRAKMDLIDDKAKNSIEEEIGKIREQLVSGADSKPIDVLSKELNLLYFKRENMTFGKPISDDPSARDMFIEATQLENNTFSEPIIQATAGLNRALIVRPLDRKYVKSEENVAATESQLSNTNEMIGNMVFENWFNKQLAQVSVEKF